MRTSAPRFFLAAAWAATALCFPAAAAAAERQVQDVVYDYAVSSYCGTLTPEVDAGFRAELRDVTAASGLSADEAKKQRIAGWVAADREWANRGLGGYRAWCQDEGVTAAGRFRAYRPIND